MVMTSIPTNPVHSGEFFGHPKGRSAVTKHPIGRVTVTCATRIGKLAALNTPPGAVAGDAQDIATTQDTATALTSYTEL